MNEQRRTPTPRQKLEHVFMRFYLPIFIVWAGWVATQIIQTQKEIGRLSAQIEIIFKEKNK